MTSLSASTTGLRYFVAKEYDGQTGAAANFIYGSVTDVKIYDNQSSPTTVTYDVNYFMRSTSGWNINSGIQNIVPIVVDEKATLVANSIMNTLTFTGTTNFGTVMGDSYKVRGEKINASDSALIGYTVSSVTFALKCQ